MKYLIVKGWLGFGDRLESLKMAVSYALQHNLQIYVDWRDPMWSHGSEDFYTYFKLINMPVLNSLEDIPAEATYYPAYWKGHLDEHLSYDFLNARMNDNLNLNILDKPFEADVIVYSSMGYRLLYPDSSFFANVFRVVDPRILNKVQEHRSRYPIERSWGLHIRGTDRVRTHKRTISIQSFVSLITSIGGMNAPHMTAVSDDKEIMEIWKRFYPSTYVASQGSIQQNSTSGNHMLGKDALNGTKDQSNVDLLVDFFVLASCERIFSTIKGSRFMVEAQRLHPHVRTILS